MKVTKEIRQLTKAAEANGFRVQERNGKYIFLSPDNQSRVVVHSTPSDLRRWKMNTVADLRRAGLQIAC